jgi:hypothetical protein
MTLMPYSDSRAEPKPPRTDDVELAVGLNANALRVANWLQ